MNPEPTPRLWDPRAPAEASLDHLEVALSRYRRSPLPMRPRRSGQLPPRSRLPLLALAAALLLGVFFYFSRTPNQTPSPSTWRVDGRPLHLATDYHFNSPTTIQVSNIGRLRLSPGTRFRILASGAQEVMRLDQGHFDAFIISDPYRFRVLTAGAHLDDLGCAYQVSVNPAGIGRVAVSLGWVRAHAAGEDSFIAQGYAATFQPGQAPSQPQPIASPTNHADVLRLLHELWRAPSAEQRVRAFETLASRYPPPPGVVVERARRADRRLVRDWWPALPLGKMIALPADY